MRNHLFSHPSEPVHPPIPAPRPSLAKANIQVGRDLKILFTKISNFQEDDADWKARAEKAEKERDDIAKKYQKLMMLVSFFGYYYIQTKVNSLQMGRTERK